MSDISTTLNACELVWRQQSIAHTQIDEMRAELEAHLSDAAREGKTPESVVGDDISAFARSWADVGTRVVPGPSADELARRQARAERYSSRLTAVLSAILVITVLGLILGPKGTTSDLEPWQWAFVIATFTLIVGELLTGGFFVLPFAIGSACAAALAFARVEPPILFLVFILVSVVSLWGLHQFAAKDDDEIVAVGANRYVGQHAVVTTAIEGVGTVGRVRFETEDWMAVADANERIATGEVVTISEVRGARLVVTARRSSPTG